MRVCVSVWSHRPTRQISRFLSNIGVFRNRGRYCFLFCKGPILNDIRGYSDPKYARLQEIASNFSKFSGGGPQNPHQRSRLRRSVRGFAPLPGLPFPKFLDPPLLMLLFFAETFNFIIPVNLTLNLTRTFKLNPDIMKIISALEFFKMICAI